MTVDIMTVRRPLPAPNVELAREQYGVTFVEPTDQDRAALDLQILGMEEARLAFEPFCQNLGITMTKPAVLYEPAAFLAEPLTAAQAATINSVETPAVAAYCLAVQEKLAAVPIKESNERLVHLPAVFEASGTAATFSETPFHEACGEWAGRHREFWARKGFAQRLLLMGALLKTAGVQLHFEDAFRPVGVQEGLFRRRVGWTRRDHPEWNDEQVIDEAKSKTAVMPRLASHKGGAAVDARLQDIATGELLDIGHNYPDGGALVFPQSPYVTAEQWGTRQLFQVAAGLSGLTLYVGEDWHVSYGDNLAALTEDSEVEPGYVATYGPIKDFDRTTGAITEIYRPDELDTVFDTE